MAKLTQHLPRPNHIEVAKNLLGAKLFAEEFWAKQFLAEMFLVGKFFDRKVFGSYRTW